MARGRVSNQSTPVGRIWDDESAEREARRTAEVTTNEHLLTLPFEERVSLLRRIYAAAGSRPDLPTGDALVAALHNLWTGTNTQRG